MGTSCSIGLLVTNLLPNLISAARMFPSLPGSSFSTRASFQNALGVVSFLTMTISPWEIVEPEFLLYDFANDCSRNPCEIFSSPLFRKLIQHLLMTTRSSCQGSIGTNNFVMGTVRGTRNTPTVNQVRGC